MKNQTSAYKLYHDEICRYGNRMLNSETEGEDLAQDVFLRFYASNRKLEGAHLRNWLFRVARNLVIDKLRKKHPERIAPEIEGAALADMSDKKSVNPATTAENQELIQKAIAWLVNCDERTREIFRLKFHECNSSSEIGIKVGVSSSTVRKILLGKLQEFREKFQKENDIG